MGYFYKVNYSTYYNFFIKIGVKIQKSTGFKNTSEVFIKKNCIYYCKLMWVRFCRFRNFKGLNFTFRKILEHFTIIMKKMSECPIDNTLKDHP